MQGNRYVIVSNQSDSSLGWEEAMRKSMGVCRTCKKAYEIALHLGSISDPDSAYRKVLETLKVKGAYTIKQREGEQEATILLVKEYK